MFDNLRDGPVRCAGVVVTAFRQQFSKKSAVQAAREQFASTSSPSGIAFLPMDQVSAAERSATLTAPGGRWGLTNEQQVDEVGDSRFSVTLYGRSGSRRLCDAAR